MKTIIASAILLSSSAMAHNTSFSSNSCNIQLNAGLKINKDLVEFSQDRKSLYKIINNETLVVNGKEIVLASDQQKLVSDYSKSIRGVIPEIKDMAVDAIGLATDGVTLALNEFLGEGNDLTANLTKQLTEIRYEIDNKFDSEQEFSIDDNGYLTTDYFGNEFESRIESVVSEIVTSSMGTLMISLGQKMLLSDGNMESFEARMENFSKQIEHEMEARGKELEKRGEALCHSVYKIDQLEAEMQNNIAEMSKFNVINNIEK